MQGMPYVLNLLYFEGCVTMVEDAHDCRKTDHHVTEPESSRAPTNWSNDLESSVDPWQPPPERAGASDASTVPSHFFDLPLPQSHSQCTLREQGISGRLNKCVNFT